MANRKYTPEQIEKAMELYTTTSKTVKEIAEEVSMSTDQIYHHAHKQGLTRTKKKPGSKLGRRKTCPNCFRTTGITDASFCPFCGSSILTQKDRIVRTISKLYTYQTDLPQTERDNFKELVDSIKNGVRNLDI